VCSNDTEGRSRNEASLRVNAGGAAAPAVSLRERFGLPKPGRKRLLQMRSFPKSPYFEKLTLRRNPERVWGGGHQFDGAMAGTRPHVRYATRNPRRASRRWPLRAGVCDNGQ
jgi:hypothetical protein